jgi:hypothetical protein
LVSFDWFVINRPDDFEPLARSIAGEYSGASIPALFRRLLNGTVRHVMVESPYTDIDYRSTFYAYYSKKARPFSSDCARIHLFGESVEFDEANLRLTFPQGTTGHYLGFVVLRPTYAQTIVRCVIDPNAIRRDDTHQLVVTDHKVHLLGHRLVVKGFPFAQQASDVAVCAQTACWGVLRYYSERWSLYRQFSLYEVTTLGLGGSVGGLRAGRGLSGKEMERVLLAAGTYPSLVTRGSNHERFEREMFGWLESGFPVIAMLDGSLHAVSVVGLSLVPIQPAPAKRSLQAWRQVKGLVVMDDRADPYGVVPLLDAPENAWPPTFALSDVTGFFVALPEKLTFPSEAVDLLAEGFALTPPKGFNQLFRQGCAVRYFVTTAAALRSHAREHASAFPSKLYDLYMRSELPQFVWVVELSSGESVVTNRVVYRLVVDATASEHESFPVFFAHSSDKALVIEHDRGRRLRWLHFHSSAVMSQMSGDLKGYGPTI